MSDEGGADFVADPASFLDASESMRKANAHLGPLGEASGSTQGAAGESSIQDSITIDEKDE